MLRKQYTFISLTGNEADTKKATHANDKTSTAIF